MKHLLRIFVLIALFTISLSCFSSSQAISLKVGETKTVSLPRDVTSKNTYAFNCSTDQSTCIDIVSFDKYSVSIRGAKEFKGTVYVYYDFFYEENGRRHSDTHTIMVDVYEQGAGGGTSGSGDDSWGTGFQDKGCWGTITVTKGSEQTVYANFPIVNEDKVKCYKWSSKGSPAFSITSKNWNKCVVKGEFTGFTGSSSRLYCYMEYGTNSYQAYYDIYVTAPKATLVSNISLNKESVSLLTEETIQLTPTISPSNATNKTVTWASDNIDVATVSSNGLVKAVGLGTATITCKAIDGSDVISKCIVNVNKLTITANPPKGIVYRGRPIILTSNLPQASIYYTLDNTTPTTNSLRYSSEGIIIDKASILQAIAVSPGYINSDIFIAEYEVVEEDENDSFVILPETWLDEGNYDISWFDDSEFEFEISTPQELAGLAYLVNKGLCYWKSVKLVNDIDLSGKMWNGIGCSDNSSFCGFFDAQGHNISGLNITVGDGDRYAGFFGYVKGGKIINLNLSGKFCADQVCTYFGGMAGFVENCTIENICCNIPIYVKNNLNKYGDGMWITDVIGGICGAATKSVFSNTVYCGDIIVEQYPKNADYDCMAFQISGFSPCLIGGTSVVNCEVKCNKIAVDFPAQIDPKKKSTTPSLYVGCFSFHNNSDALLKYCSGICNDIIVNSYADCDIKAKMIGGIISDGSKASSINCISILKRFTSTTDVKYYIDFDANKCTTTIDCFANSDVDFRFSNCYIDKRFDNVTTYDTPFLMTDSFIEQLNQYSIKFNGEPAWELGDDGYPHLIELNSTSVSNPLKNDNTLDTKIYSISGLRLKSPHKGLNIINGKKVMAK